MWFKVDDKLHDHRKTRAARRSGEGKRRDVAPMGLWVLAGSWSGDNGTRGFIPIDVLEDYDDDWEKLAQRLVDAGFWEETEVGGERGYQFHDWDTQNPLDPAQSGARGNHIRWHVRTGSPSPECELCYPPGVASDRGDIGGDRGATPLDVYRGESPPDSLRDASGRVAEPDPNPTRTRTRPEEAKASGSPRSRRRPEGPLPESWRPTAKHAAQAQDLGLDLGTEVMFFRDHAATHDRRARDWDAAFRTWLNKAQGFRRDRGRDASSPWDRAELVRAPDIDVEALDTPSNAVPGGKDGRTGPIGTREHGARESASDRLRAIHGGAQ